MVFMIDSIKRINHVKLRHIIIVMILTLIGKS